MAAASHSPADRVPSMIGGLPGGTETVTCSACGVSVSVAGTEPSTYAAGCGVSVGSGVGSGVLVGWSVGT